MKLKKLLHRLNCYLNPRAQNAQDQDEGMSKVLKKLKKKELKLKAKAEQESDPLLRNLLEQEIQLIHAQRKKGINLLAELRKPEEPSDAESTPKATDG